MGTGWPNVLRFVNANNNFGWTAYWTQVMGATKYYIYWDSAGGGSFALKDSATLGVYDTAHVILSRGDGAGYLWPRDRLYVTAANATNESGPSDTVTVKCQ